MDQIASLIKQHALFCKDEKQDSRILSYMQRAGHFEFGLDRRPINFGRDDEIKLVERLWEEGEEVRGCAVYWSSVYSYLADLLETDYEVKKSICVVHYHDLCSDSHETLKRLYADCDLPNRQPHFGGAGMCLEPAFLLFSSIFRRGKKHNRG